MTRKFDTCFFERYAQITLETVLGKAYAGLVNEDRPDLQMPDKSLGIEVTRAMEPRKEEAMNMLKEMAGLDVPHEDRISEDDREEMKHKDDLSEEEVIMTIEYASELQRHLDVKYSKMYLSLIDKLYVYDLASTDRTGHKTTCTSYDISRKMCKKFFFKALEK